MTRIEIVTQLVAAHITTYKYGIDYVDSHHVSEAGRIAELILKENTTRWFPTHPEEDK